MNADDKVCSFGCGQMVKQKEYTEQGYKYIDYLCEGGKHRATEAIRGSQLTPEELSDLLGQIYGGIPIIPFGVYYANSRDSRKGN